MATNVERTRAARTRILNAAFQSLVDVGYGRTTTNAVMRRAEISRGALLHHFPTRERLLGAAVEHVFERRLGDFRAAFAELDSQAADRPREAVRLLWRIVSGPTYYAWLELVVAARTDEVLLAEVRAVMDRFQGLIDATFLELFPPGDSAGPDHLAGAAFAFATLNGLAVDRIYQSEEAVAPVRLRLEELSHEVLGAS